MDINKINISEFTPQINLENKLMLGEVQTSYTIANDLLNMLPLHVYKNKNLKWCEPGAGIGNISIILYNKLYDSMYNFFLNTNECKEHILNMLTLIEINETHVNHLKSLFNEKNIFQKDFLNFNPGEKYDIIYGNPPFNYNGQIKVPTNTKLSKATDGITIWCDFVKKSLELLNDEGYLCFIIPCIWMKPDKAGIYDLLVKYKILKIKCFNNTETNAMFYGHAQTPCVFVIVQKITNLCVNQNIEIFDKINSNYINFILYSNKPIPCFCPSIINKIYKYTETIGNIVVQKSNMPPKHIELSIKNNNKYYYKNIKTCILKNNIPEFEYLYSSSPCPFYNKAKIILAHGMYGFPYNDFKGNLGIANRDKYVILDKTKEEMEILSEFLSTKTCLLIFEATKYRMRYLEKYIFEYIPDVTKIHNFPKIINDDTIAEFFHFNENEIKVIKSMYKNYGKIRPE